MLVSDFPPFPATKGINRNLTIEVLRLSGFLSRHNHKATNPVILLYGSPGTGKSSLCRALAQKISIRMAPNYVFVKLIEIQTASLLSKFYSESGQQVQTLFKQLCKLCASNKDTFFCMFVDEVESIARSRKTTVLNGAVEDSQRVTCELLKGIDNLKQFNNFVLVATTNFYDHLDDAFLSRCTHKLQLKPPGLEAQYTILANELRVCMSNKIIVPQVSIPQYKVAAKNLALGDTESVGIALLRLVQTFQSFSQQSRYSLDISGRSLGNLVTTSLEQYGLSSACTLDQAIGYINGYIESQTKRDRDLGEGLGNSDTNYEHHITYRSSKIPRNNLTYAWNGSFDEKSFNQSRSIKVQEETPVKIVVNETVASREAVFAQQKEEVKKNREARKKKEAEARRLQQELAREKAKLSRLHSEKSVAKRIERQVNANKSEPKKNQVPKTVRIQFEQDPIAKKDSGNFTDVRAVQVTPSNASETHNDIIESVFQAQLMGEMIEDVETQDLDSQDMTEAQEELIALDQDESEVALNDMKNGFPSRSPSRSSDDLDDVRELGSDEDDELFNYVNWK